MKAHPTATGWAITAAYYSPALLAHARAVPGCARGAKNQIVGSLDAIRLLCDRLRLAHLRFDESALPAAGAVPDTDFLMPIAAKGLRPYQLEAVRFLLSTKRCILGDEMGLGKSCSALTAARALAGRTLIVCPNYVRGVWTAEQGECTKWWPRAVVLPLASTKPCPMVGFAAPTIAVIHYDILHAWVDAIREWGPRTVIVDEGHALMNENSRQSQAVRAVAADAEFAWVLTGTPLTNRPRDLWNVVDTLHPGRLGAFFSFGIRYCDAHKEAVTPTKTVWKFDGASNLEELHDRLKCIMLRRTKEAVGLQLPPKTRQMVSVEVPAKARIMPDAGAKAMRLSLDRSADAKIKDAIALLIGHLEAGHKVVTFTHRRSVADHILDTLREAGFAGSLIHGGVAPLRRSRAIAEAQSAPGAHVLVATIDCASTGIDLSYADVAVVVELLYEPHKLLQMEARLHRFGQSKPVLIQYVIAAGTTDELIANKVIAKLDVYDKVIGEVAGGLGSDLRGSDEDILGGLYLAIEKGKKSKC